jgi:hypothetical protein
MRRLLRVRRQFGAGAVAQWLVDRTAKRFVHFQVDNLICFEVDRLPEPPPIEPGVTFRFLSPTEVTSFATDPANQLSPSMAHWVASGQNDCFGVFEGDQLAGYGWCATGRIAPEHCGGLSLWCPPHVAYMYNGFTRPASRGKRYNGLRVLFAARQLARRGVRHLVALVDWTNWPSMRSSIEAGATVLGRVVTIGRDRRRWSSFPAAAGNIGVRLRAEARPRRRSLRLGQASTFTQFTGYTGV